MNSKIGLSVVGHSPDTQGVTIEGQCLEKPIQIGDTFTTMVPNWGKDTKEVQTINLKVDSIIINGHFAVKELDHGYGGVVHLSGKGAELIKKKSSLYGTSPK